MKVVLPVCGISSQVRRSVTWRKKFWAFSSWEEFCSDMDGQYVELEMELERQFYFVNSDYHRTECWMYPWHYLQLRIC